MNIQELVRQAIERIDSMSTDELRDKFLEHGYIPANQKSQSSYAAQPNAIVLAADQANCSFFSQDSSVRTLSFSNYFSVPMHDIAEKQINYSLLAQNNVAMSLNAVAYVPTHKIAANQDNYFTRNNCDFDIAA